MTPHQKAIRRAWELKNPDKIRLYEDRRRQKTTPEERRAQHTAWRRKNAEHVKTAGQAWVEANREKARLAARTWKAANPESGLNHDAKRRAQKRNGYAGRVSYRALWAEFSGVCPLCRQHLHVGVQKYHYDHIVPLAKGGTHTQNNVQIAHAHCNHVKGAKLPVEEQTHDAEYRLAEGGLAEVPSLPPSAEVHDPGPPVPSPGPGSPEPARAAQDRPRGFVTAQALARPSTGD